MPLAVCLLRQPDGVGGLVSVAEVRVLSHAALRVASHGREGQLGLDSALFAGSADGPQAQDSVAEISNVGTVNPDALEVLIEVPTPANHGFGSYECSLEIGKPVLPDDLLVHELEQS